MPPAQRRIDQAGPRIVMTRPAAPATAGQERTSKGLEQFFAAIDGQENLSIIDFGGASQANISFITDLGHRLYADDVLRSVDQTFGTGEGARERQSDPDAIAQYLSQNLTFHEASVGGALVWDTLQFLAPPLLEAIMQRLYTVMRPGAHLFAIFSAREKATTASSYAYRITGSRTFTLSLRSERPVGQIFNNRSIEKLFQGWGSI